MGMQLFKLRLAHKPALFPLLILFAISIASCTKNTVLVKPNSPTASNLKCDCTTIKGAEKNTDIVVSEPKVLDNKGQDNKPVEAKPSDIKIFFLEKKGSQTKLHSLEIDEQGNVLNAPDGYRDFFLREHMALLVE